MKFVAKDSGKPFFRLDMLPAVLPDLPLTDSRASGDQTVAIIFNENFSSSLLPFSQSLFIGGNLIRVIKNL